MLKHLLIALALAASVACTQVDTTPADPTPAPQATPSAPVPHTPGTQLVTVTPSASASPTVRPTRTPTRINTLPPTTLTATPSASGSPQITPTPAPVATLEDCSKWTPGLMRYCQIKRNYQIRFGISTGVRDWTYGDMSPSAIAAALQTRRSLSVMAGGITSVYRIIGCDPTKWAPKPHGPNIVVFTGAQHEFGGNEFIAAGFTLDGYDYTGMATWLAWAEYERWTIRMHTPFRCAATGKKYMGIPPHEVQ